MGLDSYAYATEKKIGSPIDFRIQEQDDDWNDIYGKDHDKRFGIETQLVMVQRKISYWRNCHELDTWMQRLYYRKGGQDGPDEESEYTVQLTSGDIDAFEQDNEKGTVLRHRSEEEDEYIYNHNKVFIDKARKELSDGNYVVYKGAW